MFGTVWLYLKETLNDFIADNALSKGAAISFYTILSVGPLLVLCIAVAGIVFGEDAARGAIEGQLNGLMGDQAASVIQSMVASAGRHHDGFWATLGRFEGLRELLRHTILLCYHSSRISRTPPRLRIACDSSGLSR